MVAFAIFNHGRDKVEICQENIRERASGGGGMILPSTRMDCQDQLNLLVSRMALEMCVLHLVLPLSVEILAP